MDADQGLWEKSRREESFLRERVAALRESKRIGERSASSRSSWTSCHGWLGRMTVSHTRCVPCVCARTRVPEGREGRTEEDDDDEEEEERRRKRRRRRRRRARDTAVYYRGSVPRTASRKLRKDRGGSEVETRVGAEAEERRAREAELCEKRRRETRLGFVIYARTRTSAGHARGSGGGKERRSEGDIFSRTEHPRKGERARIFARGEARETENGDKPRTGDRE